VQLVGISLNPFEVLSQGAYYGLFHGVRLLCHSCIPGSLLYSKCSRPVASPIQPWRSTPSRDFGR